MSASIHTKYIGPTLTRGGRIKAFCRGENRPGFTLTADYPHDLPHDEKHASVAKALAERLGWSGLWIVGGNFDGSIVCACACKPGALALRWPDEFGKRDTDYFIVEEKAQP